MPRSRRSHTGMVLNGAVVIGTGFAIALVEAYRFPKGSIWVVVGAAVVLIAIIRFVTTRPR
jgi:hypothetical protein